MTIITIVEPVKVIQEIKKSRFIATAFPITSLEHITQLINKHTQSNATHHCWAYKYGQHYRFNDDNEPHGSAGKPIYLIIDTNNMDRVLIIVERYYGGIKLGIGGLRKAYGGTAKLCLEKAKTKPINVERQLSIYVNFEKSQSAIYLVNKYKITSSNSKVNYTENGCKLIFCINKENISLFQEQLANITQGNYQIKIIEKAQ